MKEGIIYKYTNKINGKVYIGQTINENERYLAHKKAGENDCPKFHNAINKYKFENFDYEVIFRDQFDDIEDAKFVLGDRERQAILDYQSFDNRFGYNLTLGGDSFAVTEETRKKISKALKGKYVKELNPMYGKTMSQESRKKMSIAKKGKYVGRNHPMYGKSPSKETKMKISGSNTGKFKGELNPNFHNGNLFEYKNKIYSSCELSKLINCCVSCLCTHTNKGETEFSIKGHLIKVHKKRDS